MGNSLASLIRTKNRAEDHLRRQHSCNSYLGESRWSVEDSAPTVASDSPKGMVKGWQLDHPPPSWGKTCSRFSDEDHRREAKLGKVLEVRQ